MDEAAQKQSAMERPLQLVVLGLLVLLGYVLRPVLPAVVLGGFIVLVAYRPFEWLVLQVHGRRRVASWIGTAAVAILLIGPMGLVAYLSVREASTAIGWGAERLRHIGGFQGLVHHLPAPLRTLWP